MKKFLVIILLFGLVLTGCKNSNSRPKDEYVDVDAYQGVETRDPEETEEPPAEEHEEEEIEEPEETGWDDSEYSDKDEVVYTFEDGTELIYTYYHGIILRYLTGEEIEIVDFIASRPEVSPDGKKIAYLYEYDFETIANVYIYDLETNTLSQETTLDYSQDQKFKRVKWLDDNHLLVIKGYAYGTVLRGGSLYLYDIADKSLTLVAEPEEMMEIVDIEINSDEVTYIVHRWIDDNYEKYVKEKETISKDDVLQLQGD